MPTCSHKSTKGSQVTVKISRYPLDSPCATADCKENAFTLSFPPPTLPSRPLKNASRDTCFLSLDCVCTDMSKQKLVPFALSHPLQHLESPHARVHCARSGPVGRLGWVSYDRPSALLSTSPFTKCCPLRSFKLSAVSYN